jgi:hypothetical protein
VTKRLIILAGDFQRQRAKQAIDEAPTGYAVEIKPATRSLDQNAKLWPMLQDISNQVDWYGQKLTKDEWKDVFSAALKKQKAVPGIDGGFVVCGQRTSTMTKSDFSDLIEVIYAFGADKRVAWTDPAQVEDMRVAA